MKTLLIVDDDKTNLINAKETLRGLYKVVAVTSGEQAISYLKKWTPDLIMLDINMPDMSGFELLSLIRENDLLASMPFIFLTADSDPETESRCLELGASDFISKPFVPTVMCSRIARILELEDLRKSLATKLDLKIKEVSDIKEKSNHDPLTGLFNRAYTKETIDEHLASSDYGALFMIDMDNFKSINDRYGHMAGDHALQLFAETMRENTGENDVLCRLGGDEFIIFIKHQTSKEKLSETASSIISDLVKKIADCNFDTNTSVSIGISQYPEDGADFDTLYTAADKALYYVKQNGKNSFHFFSEQHQDEEARNASDVDINYLRDIMKRSDLSVGSYLLEYGNFHHVYNFIHRFVERTNQDVQTLLFTLEPKDEKDISKLQMACEMFEESIFSSLRRVDVSTRYSSHQFIVLLIGTNTENGSMVAGRIIDNFRLAYPYEIDVSFDIVEMN